MHFVFNLTFSNNFDPPNSEVNVGELSPIVALTLNETISARSCSHCIIIISSSIISIIIKAFCQFKGEKRGKATHFYIQYSNLLLQYINTMRLKVWSRGPVEKLGFMCKCYRTCLLYPLGDVRLPKFKMHMCLCLSVSVYLFWVVLLSLQGQCVQYV